MNIIAPPMLKDFDYALIDCGDGRRIERFGPLTISRLCPQAEWSLQNDTVKSDVVFQRINGESHWNGIEALPETQEIAIGDIRAELRFSANGQVGIFPEQLDNWKWIAEHVQSNSQRPLKILNTFAYTGISTLFASAPHTEVCHVDGAKSAINWAKRNAELSHLTDAKIRWICDDVLKFLQREIRRGNTYDAIILDPPAFGRGGKSQWKIEKDLPHLMGMVSQLLVDKPLFVILTCHAPDLFSAEDLANMLTALPQFAGQKAEELHLEIPSEKGHALPSSFGARICA
jgi:23S rRNA (cytosine1962-C5)-methyltransferase